MRQVEDVMRQVEKNAQKCRKVLKESVFPVSRIFTSRHLLFTNIFVILFSLGPNLKLKLKVMYIAYIDLTFSLDNQHFGLVRL